MNADIGLALQVFLLGLITVGVALAIVVATGNAIIWFVNRYMAPQPSGMPPPPSGTEPDPRVIAAISAAVSAVTRGKGKVSSIEKAGR
jgi:oxaloacetate decarboxylase (Na+ extruding) subunit gamma